MPGPDVESCRCPGLIGAHAKIGDVDVQDVAAIYKKRIHNDTDGAWIDPVQQDRLQLPAFLVGIPVIWFEALKDVVLALANSDIYVS